MRTGLEQIRALRREDKRKERRLWAAGVFLFLCAFAFLLCYRGRTLGFVTPAQMGADLIAFFRMQFARLFSPALYESRALLSGLAYYEEVVVRFRSGLLLAVAGGVLALSGTVYQIATRNAMAVPTMLGVSSGVNLARILLVCQYGEAVYSLGRTNYLYCYGVSAAVLVIVLLGGKLAGGKRASVSDMLIVGTIINRVISVVINYIRSGMDTDTLTLYQEFSEKSYDLFNSFSNLGVMCLISLAVLLPIFLVRFCYNAVSFEDNEARAMGVRPGALRVYGLVAGAILTTTAMIFCGNVGMLALVVPHLCRYLFGANFGKLLGASVLLGGLMMLISRIITQFIYLSDYQIPIGNIISLLALPLLVWAMLRQKRGWE